MKKNVWAVQQRVEFGLAALEGTVPNGLCPNLTPQSFAHLPARDDIPLQALLENESADGTVSPSSNSASNTILI